MKEENKGGQREAMKTTTGRGTPHDPFSPFFLEEGGGGALASSSPILSLGDITTGSGSGGGSRR